jgi:hypothetical protein
MLSAGIFDGGWGEFLLLDPRRPYQESLRNYGIELRIIPMPIVQSSSI